MLSLNKPSNSERYQTPVLPFPAGEGAVECRRADTPVSLKTFTLGKCHHHFSCSRDSASLSGFVLTRRLCSLFRSCLVPVTFFPDFSPGWVSPWGWKPGRKSLRRGEFPSLRMPEGRGAPALCSIAKLWICSVCPGLGGKIPGIFIPNKSLRAGFEAYPPCADTGRYYGMPRSPLPHPRAAGRGSSRAAGRTRWLQERCSGD